MDTTQALDWGPEDIADDEQEEAIQVGPTMELSAWNQAGVGLVMSSLMMVQCQAPGEHHSA